MGEQEHGSDVVVEHLRRLGVDYAAINPGASFRGMHASLVQQGAPELVLALHENVAVAAGAGYAKAAGRPMAVFLHNLVGLQSGSMGIFNAWADQVPMVVVGGSGPADTTTRRPWIDWVHSARTQSLVARNFLKWDDQPASVAAIPDSIMRAHRIATTVPYGPTYVAVDAQLQEQRLEPSAVPEPPLPPDSPSITAPQATLEHIADQLVAAERPVILADYVGKSQAAYDALTRLAEALAAPVVDLMARHNFPTGHWADCTQAHHEVLADTDLALCLDLRDLAYGLGATVYEDHGYRLLTPEDARVISINTNRLMLRGFIDYAAPEGAALDVVADTAECLPVLADLVGDRAGDRTDRRAALTAFTRDLHAAPAVSDAPGAPVSMRGLSSAVHRAVSGGPWQLAHGLMHGHVRRTWDLTRFNAHLGSNTVGGGLGHGVGITIGAALAHRDDDTIVVDLQPDGDFMYTPSGLWTQARYRLPVLTVVVNNRTYGQDRKHQTLMAKMRGQPLDNARVGIDLEDPAIDFAMLARAQGIEAWGPVTESLELEGALEQAVKIVREERRPALLDVVVPR